MCPSCGEDPNGKPFCSSCGTKIPPPVVVAPPVVSASSGGDLRSVLAAAGVSDATIVIVCDQEAVELAFASDLTDADLRDMGVAQWGERKKVLAAVASAAV